MQFVPSPAKCTKSAVLRVGGRVMKSPWIFLAKKNVLRDVTVQRGWRSQRMTDVFLIRNVVVPSMDNLINLEL